MKKSDFTLTFSFEQSPQEVFNAINDVQKWWSQDFVGKCTEVDDVFEVRFGDVHFSQHLVEKLIPGKKVVWLVTDSLLNFLVNKEEWTGTRNVFEIDRVGSKTNLRFTHPGLHPEIECFKDCSKGWNYYLQNSLVPFITTGKGLPNKRVGAIENVGNEPK